MALVLGGWGARFGCLGVCETGVQDDVLSPVPSVTVLLCGFDNW